MNCVVCASRGRERQLDAGHVCPACAVRLTDTLDDIRRLAEAATCEPGGGTSGGGRTIPGSRPPIRLDGVDPELTLVDVGATERVPLLVVLEEWERLIRAERGMAPYGPASAARTAAAARTGQGVGERVPVTLTGVLGFLAAQTAWVVAEVEFPVEDYAREVAACRRALTRWDDDREPRQTYVPCPTITVDGPCPTRLRLAPVVACHRCGHEWGEDELVRLATSDPDPDVWVDAESAASAAGVTDRTVRRWGSSGRVGHRQGRYRLLDVVAMTRRDEGSVAG